MIRPGNVYDLVRQVSRLINGRSPANHPFATITSDIDEDLAQIYIHQKHGVSFLIQAEFEELQRKLKPMQKERRAPLSLPNQSTPDSSGSWEKGWKQLLTQGSSELVEHPLIHKAHACMIKE
ncbi:hypothetical protein SAY87_012642 [Trapa incisa]|uniref:Uncharacterized protein n=1 Tax=Trapa incisa TaxID=236973 RepID=A0AAN7GHS0_9MYRT|nr:hypothetical protein SAY87_012642 [Trapa incisa]